MTSAATRLVVLLGHPVAHSLSPEIHTAAFSATGLDAVYVACDVARDQLAAAVAGLGALGALGANVTVPHKQAVLELADEVTPEARAVGAANTLTWRRGALRADNTDARGVQEVLASEIGLRSGEAVLLFGAGGAARATAVALGRLGAHVEVVARRGEAAAAVAALVERSGGVARGVGEPRVVVNATPLGLHGEALPDRFCQLGPGQAALDLVYGPVRTPFLVTAEAAGAHAVDGVGMLVNQAALSFERWTARPAPREAMLDAVRAALRRQPTRGG